MIGILLQNLDHFLEVLSSKFWYEPGTFIKKYI